MIKACSQRTLVPTGFTSFDVIAMSEDMRCLVNGSTNPGLRACDDAEPHAVVAASA